MPSLPRQLLFASIACVLLPVPLTAAEIAIPSSSPVTWEWNARLRHERVGDDEFARDARATTLRLRLGTRLARGLGTPGRRWPPCSADARDTTKAWPQLEWPR